MAEAAVTFLLEEVKEVLKWYTDLISGAESDFQHLNNDLTLLKAYLKDAANKINKEQVFMELERQVREMVYDAEDTIEACLAKAAAGKEKNVVRRNLAPSRVSLAKQVRSLREDKIKPCLEKVKSFASMETARGPYASVQEPWTKQKKDQSIRQDKVVGFEDEEETIISYLMEPKKELDVISIIVMEPFHLYPKMPSMESSIKGRRRRLEILRIIDTIWLIIIMMFISFFDSFTSGETI